MLTCKDVAARASDLIDGELGPLGRVRLGLHMAICRSCARFVAQLRVTRRLTERAGEESVDLAGLSAVLARVRTGEGPAATPATRQD